MKIKKFIMLLIYFAINGVSYGQIENALGVITEPVRKVGFEKYDLFDSTRMYDEKPRHLQLLMWYPADIDTSSQSITLKYYAELKASEINVSDVTTQEELNSRARAAGFLGTLQAGFTDFHYLREIWKKTTEQDALIGVGMTGIASGRVAKLDLKEAADEVKHVNVEVTAKIGIEFAARCTTIKPSGTACWVGRKHCRSGLPEQESS